MSSVKESGAVALLTRAVQLDNEGRCDEALSCYQSGIEQLMTVMKESTDYSVKSRLKARMLEYIDRAEKLKDCIQKQKEDEKYHEQIRIEADSCGHSYEEIFGRFLDASITEVHVEDSYIRNIHQIYNFLRFCELLVITCTQLKTIHLTTGFDDSMDSQQQQKSRLSELTNSLQLRGVKLVVSYSATLHDREIWLSNGWVIQIGRGLDIFKAPASKFSIGFCDMRLRHCYETTINIFHRSHTRTAAPAANVSAP